MKIAVTPLVLTPFVPFRILARGHRIIVTGRMIAAVGDEWILHVSSASAVLATGSLGFSAGAEERITGGYTVGGKYYV